MAGKCTHHCCDLCGEQGRLFQLFATTYVCDDCYEERVGMIAECEDYCSLPLDHTGPCEEIE